MKKLTVEQARKLVEKGTVVQCRISYREVVAVRNKAKLEDLVRLQELGVQGCELFIEEDKTLPKEVMEISMEDAIELLQKGEIVYGRMAGQSYGEELPTRNALIKFYRGALVNGTPVLYWIP